MTRAELNVELLKVELDLLSARGLKDLEEVRAVRALLYRPQTDEELEQNGLSDDDLDSLAAAVEAQLPPRP